MTYIQNSIRIYHKEKELKKITVILLIIGLLAGPALFAGEPENIFPYFLFILLERHGELESIAMPEIEFFTVPGMDDAAYMMTFKTPEDAHIFTDAVQRENIPSGTYSEDRLRLVLFQTDLLEFILEAIVEL